MAWARFAAYVSFFIRVFKACYAYLAGADYDEILGTLILVGLRGRPKPVAWAGLHPREKVGKNGV